MTSPPPLGWWGRVWRYALVLIISGTAWYEVAAWQWENLRWWFWTDLAIGVTTLGLLALPSPLPSDGRRDHQRRELGVLDGQRPGDPVAGVAGDAPPLREIIPVGLLGLAAGLVLEANHPFNHEPIGFLVPLLRAGRGHDDRLGHVRRLTA